MRSSNFLKQTNSLVFKSGLYSFISLGLAMVLLVSLFIWITDGYLRVMVETENEEQLVTLVNQFDHSINVYRSELEQKSDSTTFLKAVMDPDNTEYYLSDYMNELHISNLKGDFLLITFDGMIIHSTNPNYLSGDIYNYYDDLLKRIANTKGIQFLDIKNDVIFVSSITYRDFVEGYLIFYSDFQSIFGANRHLFESREHNHSFSAFYNDSIVAEFGSPIGESITSIFPLETLPISLQVATSLSIIREPIKSILFKLIIYSCFAVFFISILFSYTTSKNMTKPLYVLEEGIKAVGEGREEVIATIRSEPQEIEFLRKSFNSIQKAIREQKSDLENSNKELTKINSDLKNTQKQLLQSEKMASIGQLAAGVAHEINNPTGFVTTNLHTMKEYFTVFTQLFKQMDLLIVNQKTNEDQNVIQILNKIEDIKNEEDFSFIMEDSPQLLEESIDGTVRIKDIVNGLRNFARPDSKEYINANINEGIESALKLTSNELKYTCIVEKKLEEIPDIPCRLDQLTQVFVNLLVNAAHAIEKNGTISIHTWSRDEWVFISISDTGSGIPEGNLAKLFDPFFTTKEVGKGTGLGLSISYGIIEEHGGSIDVKSSPGEGTCFTIKLLK